MYLAKIYSGDWYNSASVLLEVWQDESAISHDLTNQAASYGKQKHLGGLRTDQEIQKAEQVVRLKETQKQIRLNQAFYIFNSDTLTKTQTRKNNRKDYSVKLSVTTKNSDKTENDIVLGAAVAKWVELVD